MFNESLFVGGPADGCRIETQGQRVWSVLGRKKPLGSYQDGEDDYEKEDYFLQYCMDDNKGSRIPVYVHTSIVDLSLAHTLILRYPSPIPI